MCNSSLSSKCIFWKFCYRKRECRSVTQVVSDFLWPLMWWNIHIHVSLTTCFVKDQVQNKKFLWKPRGTKIIMELQEASRERPGMGLRIKVKDPLTYTKRNPVVPPMGSRMCDPRLTAVSSCRRMVSFRRARGNGGAVPSMFRVTFEPPPVSDSDTDRPRSFWTDWSSMSVGRTETNSCMDGIWWNFSKAVSSDSSNTP